MAYTVIDKSTAHFTPKLWSGNSSSQAINGLEFAPNWVWGKNRSGTQPHQLLDTTRGANNILSSNTSTGNVVDSQILNSFNSDGFTLGSQDQLNDTGQTYVGWNWKAGTTSGIATDATTTITPSSYSFNQTAGFSIIRYSGNGVDGAYLPHGLGASPKVMIVKRLNDNGEDWYMYNTALGNQKYMKLNSAAAISGTDGMWGSYTPDSVNMKMSNDAQIGASGGTFIMYCFADIQGYSKISSYIGSGNTNGTFVYTGFKPSWVLIKNTAASEAWFLYDNKRGVNGAMKALFPDENAADGGAADNIDLLSNGFKLRTAGAILNSSGAEFIYMAFAENPFVTSTGIPGLAR